MTIGYTIVGGFLGAGKTTLINAMLSTADQRLAVIVNDIGQINVDAALLASRSPDESPGGGVLQLTNGCVCCSIGDSLAETLRTVCTGADPPEHVVLECSGAADPGRVARYGNRRILAAATIVVVVDAGDVRRRAQDPRFAPLVMAQLAAADQLVVTKTDLTPSDDGELERWLAANSDGTIMVGHPRQLGRLFPMAGERGTSSGAGPEGGSDTPGMGPNLTDREAVLPDRRLTVATLHLPQPVEVDAVLRRLAAADGLIRAKGIVQTPGGPVLVQWAADRFHHDPWPWPTPQGQTGIVTISCPDSPIR